MSPGEKGVATTTDSNLEPDLSSAINSSFLETLAKFTIKIDLNSCLPVTDASLELTTLHNVLILLENHCLTGVNHV